MGNGMNGISRRGFLRGLGTGAALAAYATSAEAKAEDTRPPNFVIIFIDDLGYQDLGCFGAKLIKTPCLDKMAAEGARFTSFYAQPSCSPSRAALMTGCYPQRAGIPRVLFPQDKIGINADEVLLPQVLKTRGYATACIGKWHLGHLPPFLPTRHGFDYYSGLPYTNDREDATRGDPPLPLMRNEEIIEQPAVQDTLTQRYTQEATAFIREHKDQPFFLYLPHSMVHVPLHVSEAFRGKSAQGLYGDAVQEIDWSVGEVLKTIQECGIDENTLVLFTSDNGPWLIKKEDGGAALPLRDGKGTTYEGGLREPTIMRWPGHIPAGTTCPEMAATMDLLPTFAALAGAQAPTDRIIDGKDIGELLWRPDTAKSPRNTMFYYRNEELQAVREGPWKLHLALAKRPDGELYDLDADIGESKNVAAEHPNVVKRLNELADKVRADLGDSNTGVKGSNCRPAGRVE
jgi:arylsulfatase A-like enzyme